MGAPGCSWECWQATWGALGRASSRPCPGWPFASSPVTSARHTLPGVRHLTAGLICENKSFTRHMRQGEGKEAPACLPSGSPDQGAWLGGTRGFISSLRVRSEETGHSLGFPCRALHSGAGPWLWPGGTSCFYSSNAAPGSWTWPDPHQPPWAPSPSRAHAAKTQSLPRKLPKEPERNLCPSHPTDRVQSRDWAQTSSCPVWDKGHCWALQRRAVAPSLLGVAACGCSRAPLFPFSPLPPSRTPC